MGQLDLVDREREQQFRQIQTRDGSTSTPSLAIRNGSPCLCLRDDDSQDGKRRGYPGTELPQVRIWPQCMDELLYGDPPHLRQMRGYHHDKLQRVEISRFYSSKSLLELTSHILENSSAMERLTLDTTDGIFRCSDGRPGKCFCLGRPMEAHKAVLVIGKYIEVKVPSTVKLNVVEPCSRCHANFSTMLI